MWVVFGNQNSRKKYFHFPQSCGIPALTILGLLGFGLSKMSVFRILGFGSSKISFFGVLTYYQTAEGVVCLAGESVIHVNQLQMIMFGCSESVLTHADIM